MTEPIVKLQRLDLCQVIGARKKPLKLIVAQVVCCGFKLYLVSFEINSSQSNRNVLQWSVTGIERFINVVINENTSSDRATFVFAKVVTVANLARVKHDTIDSVFQALPTGFSDIALSVNIVFRLDLRDTVATRRKTSKFIETIRISRRRLVHQVALEIDS